MPTGSTPTVQRSAATTPTVLRSVVTVPANVRATSSIAPVLRAAGTTSPVLRAAARSLGPRGPQGEPGLATELTTAAEAISALKPVVIIDGEASVADSSDPSHKGFLAGIAETSATVGNQSRIRIGGRLQDDSWSWDTSKPWIFVGAGVLTQTPPTSGWLQSVARVESADTIFVELSEVTERV